MSHDAHSESDQAAPAAQDGGPARPAETLALTRGVCRLFVSLGFAPLCELSLRSGRRVDVMGLGRGGEIIVAEIKSSLEDFRADQKWAEYLDYCDRFFFAVGAGFPQEILPGETGLIIADRFGGAVVRESPVTKLHASRRKELIQRFATQAADRLARTADPEIGSLYLRP